MAIPKDLREALVREGSAMMKAAFEQGKSAQRVEDAQAEFFHDTQHAQHHMNNFFSMLNAPEKSEIN